MWQATEGADVFGVERPPEPPLYPVFMGVTAAALLEQVFALPESERQEFVAQLIARFPAPDDSLEVGSPVWAAEIERRARRALVGESAAEDWEIAEQRILARLADE